MASSYITSRQIEGEKEKEITDFIFLGSKITADSDYSHETESYTTLGIALGKEQIRSSAIGRW